MQDEAATSIFDRSACLQPLSPTGSHNADPARSKSRRLGRILEIHIELYDGQRDDYGNG